MFINGKAYAGLCNCYKEGYVYRIPILKEMPVPPFFLVEADRLRWEYENAILGINKISESCIGTVELIDFQVRTKDNLIENRTEITVWLRPNRYTLAQKEICIGECFIMMHLADETDIVEDFYKKVLKGKP